MDKSKYLRKIYGLFSEHWTPKIIGESNGQYVKIAKAQGRYGLAFT